MKYSRIVGLILTCMVLGRGAWAQTEYDAWRYSELSSTGTARGLGMGGAMTAVGADLGTLALNPAGVGMFRRSEVTITPTFHFNTTGTDFIGQSSTGTRTNFGFGNLGAVFIIPREAVNSSMGLKQISIGVGFNQLDNYHRNIEASAYNRFNSLGDYFAFIAADGVPINNLGAGSFAAFRAYLIDTVPGTNPLAPQYAPTVAAGQVQQSISYAQRGRRNEWAVAAGLNFGDRIYAGISLGFSDYSHRETWTYREEDINGVYLPGNIPPGAIPFQSMVYTDEYYTTGSGINVGIGIIGQVTEQLRLAVSYYSPTWNNLTLNYSPAIYMRDHTGRQDPPGDNTQFGDFSFTFNTPGRVNAGAVYVFGKKGLLSADVTYSDITEARFGPAPSLLGGTDYNFAAENEVIRQRSQALWSYRVGAEFRPTKKLYLRAGYNHTTGPQASSARSYEDLATYDGLSGAVQRRTVNTDRSTISGGIGYRWSNLFIDVAFLQHTRRDFFPWYILPTDPAFTAGQNQQIGVDGSNNPVFGLGGGYAPVLENTSRIGQLVFTFGFAIH